MSNPTVNNFTEAKGIDMIKTIRELRAEDVRRQGIDIHINKVEVFKTEPATASI